jgi:hypothetical protein
MKVILFESLLSIIARYDLCLLKGEVGFLGRYTSANKFMTKNNWLVANVCDQFPYKAIVLPQIFHPTGTLNYGNSSEILISPDSPTPWFLWIGCN